MNHNNTQIDNRNELGISNASSNAQIFINNQVSGDASKNDNDQKELIKEEG